MIEVKDVSKVYAGHAVLDNLSFSVEKNDILGIVGKSGSGKTTLLKLLNLVEKPTTGQILLEQKATDRLSKAQIA